MKIDTLPRNMIRTCTVLCALSAGLASAPSEVHAVIVNEDTGEGWKPGLDEDGNPDEPPDWVNSQWGQGTAVVTTTPTQGGAPTILVSEDVCHRPISDWIISSTPNLDVSDAIKDGGVRTSFIHALEAWGTHAVAVQVAGLGASLFGLNISTVTPGAMSVNHFSCPTPYTLMDCLSEGHDMWYCKTHASTTAVSDVSDVDLLVPLTVTFIGAFPVSGTLLLEGNLTYREVDNHDVYGVEEEICIHVNNYEVDGFGFALNGTVSHWVDDFYLGPDNTLCVPAPMVAIPKSSSTTPITTTLP